MAQLNNILGAPGVDGWTNPNESWTFASSTTINVPNGALYQAGDFIKFTQSSTVKYFVVVSISSNVLTLCSQDAGVTTTVANAAITANFFSRQAAPLGLPVFTWTPAYTGMSANPTIFFARFFTVGKMVTVQYSMNAGGTSNATSFTITGLPIAILTATAFFNIGEAIDNAANFNTARGDVTTTVLTLFKDTGGTAWTNTSTKGVYNFSITYAFAS